MPIYEYGCAKCGAELEVWQKISEKPKRKCPSCGAQQLQRLISNTAFHLKGSGWYVTDYAKKSGASPAAQKASDTESSKGTGDKVEKKADAKAEKKADTKAD